MAADLVQRKKGQKYIKNGEICESYGCYCDHPTDGTHDTAVYNNKLAKGIYEETMKEWGNKWTGAMWAQEYACTTTGAEGTKKSLLSKEEMEILGKCWARALFLKGEKNPATGKVYEDCAMSNCRMGHEDLYKCTNQQIELMKAKMLDTQARPQNKYQGKTKCDRAAGSWDNPNKKTNQRDPGTKKPQVCPFCKEPGHKQQECDADKFPVIHEFCWMCNVHGHSACDYRFFQKEEEWEKQFEKRCAEAVKEDRVVHCRHGKPLTGPNKMYDKWLTGRRIKGQGDLVPWAPEQLETRRSHKVTETAKMQIIAQKIRSSYPTLKPDEA
jgi:hypothetical protein